MTISYNSPVILTYALLSGAALTLFYFTGTFTGTTFVNLFSTPSIFNLFSPLMYFRLISHIFGHVDFNHLLSNFTIILLIGPLVEEKYSSFLLAGMILFTALTTGLLNLFLFSTSLMGASGIVFLLILLSSMTNFRNREIPLTFILIMIIFLGSEVVASMNSDNISQFAHIIGGICGACFGFIFNREKTLY